MDILEDIQATIISQKGTITGYQGYQEKRIGITSPIVLRCRDKTLKGAFEIARLPKDTSILIGLNILADLGISIVGVPIDYPDMIIKSTDNMEQKGPDSIIDLEMIKEEQDDKFKDKRQFFLDKIDIILQEHLQSTLTQPGTFCIVPESIVNLPLSTDYQLYI